jgi:hypothetical protein
MLQQTACGFGHLALLGMLNGVAEAGTAAGNPLAAKPPHFAPRAKSVIFLFMHGGVSQIETFDPKPELDKWDGQPLPFEKPLQFAGTGNLMRSCWRFHQHGQSGLPVSTLFPHLASVVDELCIIRSMTSERVDHGGATIQLHTGSALFTRPSMGSWVLYGLGTENRNLPGFVTLKPAETNGGPQNYGSAFLPATYQGTRVGFNNSSMRDVSFENVQPYEPDRRLQRKQLDLLQALNRDQLRETDDSRLAARIEAFELAFRMQAQAPNLFDLSDESEHTLQLYGVGDRPTGSVSGEALSKQEYAKYGRTPTDNPTDEFGRQCLMARRLVERGVRFVQCTHTGAGVPKWDQHSDLKVLHEANALEVDRPIAGLIQDLKQRGLLDETLVIFGSEFGRTPVTQGKDMASIGRDHNPYGFSIWMAGGGMKPGISYGATDDFGYFAVDNICTIYDLHATILHLLGLDHERLTYRYSGRDFRLTDVHGKVVHDVIA